MAKAALIKDVLRRTRPVSVLDLGCGDGVVISQVEMPPRYIGYDPSLTALERCRELMPRRTFTDTIPEGQFDLVLSLDVMHHLVDDTVYAVYLAMLFAKSRCHVLVYGTNEDQRGLHCAHVLHRQWVMDIPSGWAMDTTPTKYKMSWLMTREDEQ